jgi:hypothetical protein
MLVVIGLIGAKDAGKSTFAEAVLEKYGVEDNPYFVRQGALADKLKDVCADLAGLPSRAAFDDPKLKEEILPVPVVLNMQDVDFVLTSFGLRQDLSEALKHDGKILATPRQVAQYVGTEVLRSVEPDVHCKGLMSSQPEYGVLIVTDIRFPNELEFFRAKFGTNFRSVGIRRSESERLADQDSHSSERHREDLLSLCDFILSNNASQDDFRAEAVALFDKVISQYEPSDLRGPK